MARRLANELQSVHHPHLGPFVCIERFAGRAVSLDVRDRVLNIHQTDMVGSHEFPTSDRDSVAQYSLTRARAQTTLGHHVDTAPE